MSNWLPATNGELVRTVMEYVRHQPQKTLLYQVIDEYYPKFLAHLSASDKTLPKKVERLCRYIARPAVSTHRLERLPDGKISYELKTPYKNGTTHVVFEPLDFIARLAALVPKPRFHLTRYHGVFAPNSKHRGIVTSEHIGEKIPSAVTESFQVGEERRTTRSKIGNCSTGC